jgi:hypothetical protein
MSVEQEKQAAAEAAELVEDGMPVWPRASISSGATSRTRFIRTVTEEMLMIRP